MTIDLVPEWTIGDLRLTSPPFGVDADSGVDIGEPEMVVEGVASSLADGDVERVVRHGNRTYVIPLYIEGLSLGELAASEARLRSELRRTGLRLTHDPGDPLSPASVYEVQTAQLTPQRNDTHESHLIRKFTLTLTCGPWALSAEPVTVEALTSGSTTVVVDTCDSATGWTATRNGAPQQADTLDPGVISSWELDNAAGFPPEQWTLTRTGAVDFSATPYLEVELTTLSAKGGAPLSVSAHLNGSPTPLPILQVRRLADNPEFFRVTFETRGVAASSITFKHTSSPGYGAIWQGLQVRNVARTNISPNITPRQLTRIIDAGGTERTPASLHVSTASGAIPLGMAIVHTSPEDGSGYSPPLRRWRTSGQTVLTDSSAISGQYESITGTGITCFVPTNSLPEGGYELVARLRCTVVGTVNVAWSTSTYYPTGSVEEGFVSGIEVIKFEHTGWHIVPLATLSLPSVRTKAGSVRMILQAPVVGGGITHVDEAWLFRVGEDCALSVVKTDNTNLWLNSPGVDSPVPTVWVGNTPEMRVHPGTGLVAQGTHVLSPEGTAVFTATLADNTTTSATAHRRWHSNAAS